MPTPSIVQRVVYATMYEGSNSVASQTYTLRLPNATIAGNNLVVILNYDSTSNTVSSITDNTGLNTWSTTPRVAHTGAFTKSEVYVLANNLGGVQAITIHLTIDQAGNGTFQPHFIELSAVDPGTPVGVTDHATVAGSAGAVLFPRNVAPQSGNLLFYYVYQQTGTPGNGTQDIGTVTAGASWTLEFVDRDTGSNTGTSNDQPQCLERIVAPGGNVQPTLTMGASTNDYSCLTWEMNGGSSGSNPGAASPAGHLHIKRVTWFSPMKPKGPLSYAYQLPTDTGNLILMYDISGNITAAPTDSTGDVWTLANAGHKAPQPQSTLVYLKNASATKPTRTLTITNVAAANNVQNTMVFYEIENADTKSPLIQQKFATDLQTGVGQNFIAHAPDITPITPNGLITNLLGVGAGPVTGLSAPSGGLFMTLTYPGENDFDPFNNSDGYACFSYGANLGLQNWTWNTPLNATAIFYNAVEWKDQIPTAIPAKRFYPATRSPNVTRGFHSPRAKVVPNLPTILAGSINGMSSFTTPATDLILAEALSGPLAGATSFASSTPDLTVAQALAGALAGASTLQGALSVLVPLSGNLAGATVVSGTLSEAIAIAGSLFGISSLSSNLTEAIALSGAVYGVAVINGSAVEVIALGGSISCVAALFGGLGGPVSLAGNIGGIATVQLTLAEAIALAGTIPGASVVTGILTTSGGGGGGTKVFPIFVFDDQ